VKGELMSGAEGTTKKEAGAESRPQRSG